MYLHLEIAKLFSLGLLQLNEVSWHASLGGTVSILILPSVLPYT